MKTNRILIASKFVPILLCVSVSSAEAQILRAGDILRITFTTHHQAILRKHRLA